MLLFGRMLRGAVAFDTFFRSSVTDLGTGHAGLREPDRGISDKLRGLKTVELDATLGVELHPSLVVVPRFGRPRHLLALPDRVLA